MLILLFFNRNRSFSLFLRFRFCHSKHRIESFKFKEIKNQTITLFNLEALEDKLQTYKIAKEKHNQFEKIIRSHPRSKKNIVIKNLLKEYSISTKKISHLESLLYSHINYYNIALNKFPRNLLGKLFGYTVINQKSDKN